MHESGPQLPPSAETIARGHESSTVDLRGFVVFLGVLIALGAVVCVAMWVVMISMEKLTERRDPEISPLAAKQPIKVPEPWLQPSRAQGSTPATEKQDLDRLREAEDKVLNSYALDSRTGTARIPIDRAMEIFVQRAATSRPAGGVP